MQFTDISNGVCQLLACLLSTSFSYLYNKRVTDVVSYLLRIVNIKIIYIYIYMVCNIPETYTDMKKGKHFAMFLRILMQVYKTVAVS